jgi:tetratricopeptide (TPR) repeat protein
VCGALAAGALAFGATWYLHVPVPSWIGSRDVKAATETVSEPIAARSSPDTADALFARGEIAFDAGHWAEAAGAYQRAVALRGDFVPAHTRWARALLNEHRVSEAIDRAQQAVSYGPRDADARAVLAVAFDWSGQVDRAAVAGDEAVELDSTAPFALAALAEASADQYRLMEADELLQKALGLTPNEPELYRVQGSVREARADYAGAVESYRHAIDLAPDWSYLYVSLGHALRVQGQHDGALDAFGRAVELAPDDARAEGGRGMVYFAREDYDPAIASFQRALELDPVYPTAYAQLAWIRYARREYDQAEPLFNRAIELDHDPAHVAQYRHALGWIMLSERRNTEAREQFIRALELNPNLQGARDGLKALQGPGSSAAAPMRGR